MADSISTSHTFSPKHISHTTTLPITDQHTKIEQTPTLFFHNYPVLPSYGQKIIAELVGTYILIFTGCGAALVDRDRPLTIIGIAMAWGLCLTALIYALGHVSGAHFNPAVSISFASSGKLPLLHMLMYVVSQVLGSTLACITLKMLFNHQRNILPTMTKYSTPTTDAEAFVWEFIITFILMFTICGAATDDRSTKELAGVAIGVTLLFNIIIAGPITGASMNPARSIGPAVVAGEYEKLWVFIVAPVIGAIAANIIYSLLRQPTPERYKVEIDSTKSTYNDLFSQSIV